MYWDRFPICMNHPSKKALNLTLDAGCVPSARTHCFTAPFALIPGIFLSATRSNSFPRLLSLTYVSASESNSALQWPHRLCGEVGLRKVLPVVQTGPKAKGVACPSTTLSLILMLCVCAYRESFKDIRNLASVVICLKEALTLRLDLSFIESSTDQIGWESRHQL